MSLSAAAINDAARRRRRHVQPPPAPFAPPSQPEHQQQPVDEEELPAPSAAARPRVASPFAAPGPFAAVGHGPVVAGPPRPQEPPERFPKLHNVVATINLNCPLNLKDIATKCRNTEYTPKRLNAAVMRIREPKTTALVFKTGKIVVTGAKSEDDLRLAAKKYAKIIEKLGFQVRLTDIKFQNLVASIDVRFPIMLETMADEHKDLSSYEPELFPGLIYRMSDPKVCLLIFVSGKVVLTGAKSKTDIDNAYRKIYPELVKYKKQPRQD